MSEAVVAIVLFGLVILFLAVIMALLDEHDGFPEVGTELDRSTTVRRGRAPTGAPQLSELPRPKSRGLKASGRT
jgi:hypothetical protein